MSRSLAQGYALLGGAVGTTTLALALRRLSQCYQAWKAHQRERLAAASRLIDTAQGAVECQMDGEGPVVLLVHGSPGGYDQGLALAHGLGLEGVTTVALSRPGYRRTPLTSGPTPEEQADLCARLLDTLGVADAVVIALSGGGPAGLCYAVRHPERCRGLVLLSAVSQPTTEEGVYRSLLPAHRLFRRILDRLLEYDPFLYLLFTLLPDDAPRAYVAALLMNRPLAKPAILRSYEMG